MKKCNNCGKKVPEDSEFCQYCGSNDVIEISQKIVAKKKCNNCGKKVPEDSEFCQYCGSKDIVEINEAHETIKYLCLGCKKEVSANDAFCPHCGRKLINSLENGDKDKKLIHNIDEKKKNNKGNSISTLVLSYLLIISIFSVGFLYYKLSNSILDNKNLSEKLLETENQLQEYEEYSNKYLYVYKYSMDSDSYNDAYAKETIVNQPKWKTISVYWGRNEEIYMDYENCNAKFSNKWDGNWTYISVMNNPGKIGYIKIHNKSNTRKFTITVIG